MIHFLSKSITHFFLVKKKINESEVELYNHGIEIIISTVIGFILVLLAGIFSTSIDVALIFYFLFVVLRSYTGGYHADTHLKCKVILFICCCLTILLTNLLEEKYNIIMHNIYILFFLSSVVAYAPVVNQNKPLSEEKIKSSRLKSRIIAIFISLVSYIIYFFCLRLVVAMDITLVFISLLLIIGYQNERRELSYEEW